MSLALSFRKHPIITCDFLKIDHDFDFEAIDALASLSKENQAVENAILSGLVTLSSNILELLIQKWLDRGD